MHLEILTKEQKQLLPLIAKFYKEYYMVGGTAIALHIGHRVSIDFDLFKQKKRNERKIYEHIESFPFPTIMTFKNAEQINFMINEVKFTFFTYYYSIPLTSELKGIIKMPDLLTLAAMKAFALGRRAKWKDYVDLYFIIKDYFTINQISEKANDIYSEHFSAKLFRVQLSYFEGIDYSEQVHYLIPNPPTEEEIKTFLADVSLEM